MKPLILTIIIVFPFFVFGQTENDTLINYSDLENYNIDTLPTFPGGKDAFRQFINSNLKYPEKALENEISGKVYVRFVVTDEGDVDQVQIARSVDSLLDNEVLRVFRLMPKWIPATSGGKPISVWYTFPVNFNLY